jgi:hypothetical protein
VRLINQLSPATDRELVTFGGDPIPIAPVMDDTAIRNRIAGLPSTPLETGVRETMERFAALHNAGRLDISDIEAEIKQYS